jgi:hypothetical protein
MECQCNKIKFWGKILGTRNDYYIAECSVEDPFSESDGRSEHSGAGANTHIYFVCNHPLQDWVKLPDVHPTHIKSARLFKRLLTGLLLSILNIFFLFFLYF